MRHLAKHDREAIIDIIDAWPPEPKLTWERLRVRIEVSRGIYPTRQTLARHASIHLAFKRRKEEVPQVRLSASEKLLREQVQQLTAKNANLSDEVNRLRQLFLQLQYSLYKKGFTEEMFLEAQMQPLPRIDRDRSV